MSNASNRLRSKINDRRKRDGAYGRARVPVCLNPDLIFEHQDALARKAVIEREVRDSEKKGRVNNDRLSGDSDDHHSQEIAEIDARIEELRPEIEDETMVIILGSLGDVRWSEFLAKHTVDDDENRKENREERIRFLDDLVDQSFLFIEDAAGERTDLTLDEIRTELSFGQADDLRAEAQNLNLRRANVPFSLAGSKNRRKTSKTSPPQPHSDSATDDS